MRTTQRLKAACAAGSCSTLSATGSRPQPASATARNSGRTARFRSSSAHVYANRMNLLPGPLPASANSRSVQVDGLQQGLRMHAYMNLAAQQGVAEKTPHATEGLRIDWSGACFLAFNLRSATASMRREAM